MPGIGLKCGCYIVFCYGDYAQVTVICVLGGNDEGEDGCYETVDC